MTELKQDIVIPISKQKLILLTIGALIFVGLGILFVTNPEKYTSPIMRDPTFIFISGVASFLFFGLCAPFIFKKLWDKSPGLKITDQGILDNSSGVSAGQIYWEDIEDISVLKIHRQKLIMLQVKNPQAYIDKQTSGFKQKMMALNYKMYGTPLSITSNGLKISFDELLSILTEKLKASRQ
jgi:hypothetical protein